MIRISCLYAITLIAATACFAQQEIPLYSGSIPNAKETPDEEIRRADYVVSKVSRPTLSIFLPPSGKANGTAIIICPEGGYGVLVMKREGYDVAEAFTKMGIDPVDDYQAMRVGYSGPKSTSQEKIQSFLTMLERLEPGKTYLFVDHPGLDSEELGAIHYKEYEDVATDRQGVTDVWTNQQVKALIKQRNIQLISYKDLLK